MTQNSYNLRNVTPEIEQLLNKIGIDNKRQFLKIGAEKTYLLLLDAGHPTDDNLRYRLLGAEQDMDWEIIASSAKARAKSRFADYSE